MKPVPSNNFLFSNEKVEQFKQEYPTTSNNELAEKYGLKLSQLYRWAYYLKLKKSKIVEIRTEKPCSHCKVVKKLEDFYTDHNRSDKKQSFCKSCSSKKCKSYNSRYYNFLIDTPNYTNKETPPEWWVKKNLELIK